MQEFTDTAALPQFLATAVGSLPHFRAEDAVELILQTLERAPHAPQLSRMDPREQMWIQLTEGLPRFKVDLQNLTYRFDLSGDTVPALEAFYSSYLDVVDGKSADAFAISPDYGRGIHLFLDRLRSEEKKLPFVKVQVTGPLSFGLTITDNDRKPVFYHPLFRDVAVKGMGLKAVWLVDQFKPLAEHVIVFFDEPCLSAYGTSAYIGVSKDDVIESLNDVIDMAAARGAIPGIHCCGNTDWGLLMDTSVRIINFDAVSYMDSLAIYADKVTDFLDRGGVLAWGAVPNDERIEAEDVDTVARRLQEGLGLLEKAGVPRDLLRKKMIVTPACGCAGMTIEQTRKAYGVLSVIQERGISLVS